MTDFSILLLTAPSEKIAEVYLDQLQALKSTLPALQSCKAIYCVADPSGVRVGSGGGTLNALDFLHQRGINTSKEKILLIHSGGDSRRAPLYSLCGKAWITLNAIVGGTTDTIANPLSVLIDELSRFATNLGPESLVIASSDVLLDLTDNTGY
jgi:fucokinase